MINLLKSKFFLGVMVVAIMFVGAFALNTEKASADCSIYSTLRIGSVGVDVQCLQTKVGANVDGKFGPMTLASVKAWQASHGLVADGIVGSMTRATLNALDMVSGNFPVGCTSAVGYSTITGLPCLGGFSNLPAGCLPGYVYSATTGMPCSGSLNLPAGCTSTLGYSPTTGVKCDTNQNSGNDNGDLHGSDGDITVSQTAADVENEVAEGRSEKVLGFRVEAEDSDVRVNSVKVTVENTDTASSRRPDRYLNTIEIWKGDTKVGSIKATDLTRGSGNTYSKTITLSDAVVREGSGNKQTFYVVFKAVSKIDSSDMQSASFDLDLNSIRFSDASGSIMTSSASLEVTGIIFTDLATSGEVRMKVSLGGNNPDEGSVQVNEFSSTSNVPLLGFQLKAESTDMSVSELSVNLESTVSNLNKILSEVKLMKGSTTIADYSGPFDGDMSQRIKFDLYDDLDIDEGDTKTLQVVAKLLKQDNNFDNGATLRASLATPLATYLVAEDENGDDIVNFSGSATGYAQTLFVNGATIAYVSSTSTQVDQAGKVRDFTLVFDVTAVGDDLTVDRTSLDDNNNDGIQYIVSGSGTNTESANLSSNASLSGNVYTVYEGQTRRFTLTVTVTTDTTGQKKIVLEEIAGVSTTSTIESTSATVIQ